MENNTEEVGEFCQTRKVEAMLGPWSPDLTSGPPSLTFYWQV